MVPCDPIIVVDLLPPRIYCLLHALCGARDLRSLQRLVGDYDIFELVLGDGFDSVCVCKSQNRLLIAVVEVLTYANDYADNRRAGDCVLDQVRCPGSQQGWLRLHAGIVVRRLERPATRVSMRYMETAQAPY